MKDIQFNDGTSCFNCRVNDMLKYFEGEQEVLDNKNAIYRWFDLDELDHVPMKPECSREILKNRFSDIQHYIERDN